MRSFMFAVLLLFAPCAVARPADTGDLLSDVVDTVDVYGDRPGAAALLRSLTGLCTVHTLRDAPPGADVARIIEEGVGVDVRRYGGLESHSAVSIRGSSSAQVEVYLDDVPLRSAQWGEVDLSELPTSGVERIEVYRGTVPSWVGASPAGGAIRLVTSGAGGRHADARLLFGSHGYAGLSATRGCAAGPLDLFVSLSHFTGRGDFDYLDDRGTPENELDDVVRDRVNNWSRRSRAAIRAATTAIGGWRFELADDLLWSERGIPGTGGVPIESAGSDLLNNTARVAVEPPRFAGGALELRVAAFSTYRRNRFYNPANEVGLNRSDTVDRAVSGGGNMRAVWRWFGAGNTMTFSGAARSDRFTPEDGNPVIGEGFTRSRSTLSGAVEDRLLLAGDHLALAVSWRGERSEDNYAGPSPFGAPPEPLEDSHVVALSGASVGASWKVRDGVTVRANRARVWRLPSMLELFGASGDTDGNAELEAERGTTMDAGLEVDVPVVGGMKLAAGAFRTETEDLIVFLQNSQQTVKAFNLESAEVEGFELSARVGATGPFSLSLSYTHEDATNTGPSTVYSGRRLPHSSEHRLFARTRWRERAWSVYHELRHESESYLDRANLPENLVPARTIHTFGAEVLLASGALSLSAEVQNLTDVRAQDVAGYPLPGRTFVATIGFRASNHKEATP